MKSLVIDDFFVSNVFFPFLVVCFVLGIMSFLLIFVHYIVCRVDEILKKDASINDTFSSIKGYYKKELLALEKILYEIKKFSNHYGEYEEELIQKIFDDRVRCLKKLEKIDKTGRSPGSIRGIIELENKIQYCMQQVLSVGAKYPDIKSYSKYLTYYAEYKDIEDKIDTSRGTYNRKVKEFNHFLITYPYIIFAIIFKIEPRQLF